MTIATAKFELAFDNAGPSSRIHDPAGGDREFLLVAVAEGNGMKTAVKDNVLYRNSVTEFCTLASDLASQLILKAASVDLIGGNRGQVSRSYFHSACDFL